jgi:hypothetical protein
MLESERDRFVYARAMEYLLSFASLGVTPELLERYINPSSETLRPSTTAGIYQRILESAANRGMSSGVIDRSIGGIQALAPVLCDFKPDQIMGKFGDPRADVLEAIVKECRPRGKIRREAKSIWPQFCRTIVTGANFMQQFGSANEFYEWVDVFDRDDRTRPALPMLLSLEITGFGFALACDFLKEIGYLKFGKPDVHLHAIFEGLGLTNAHASDYELFKAIARVARHQEVSPYNVDKLFWLVGSGYFHRDEDRNLGTNGRISTDRTDFINQVRKDLPAVQT